MGYNRSPKPSLLKKDFSELFSSLYINADILQTNKSIALYKFTTIFFPNIGPSILNLLLDMERLSRKVIASIKVNERERLVKELEGITIEMRYLIKDQGRELMVLPIQISPSEVLRNATLVKLGSRDTQKMRQEINRILISFIRKEIQRKIKTMTEDFLKNLLTKPKVPAMFKRLLSLGLIDKEGHLAEGTTIKDLISGKYARLFKKVIPEEFINEAVLIQETFKAYYDWEGEDYQTLANEVLREKGILALTLGEIRKREQRTAETNG